MPRARKEQISVAETPYYHIVSRCVRRTFLCGVDRETGRSFEHRRTLIEQRLRLLASIFHIDIAAYAVMSNHYHLVVKLYEPSALEDLTDDDIIQRWRCLYKGPLLLQKYLDGSALDVAEKGLLDELVALYRKKLCSISEFMKCLNQPIARQANKEDNCTGHFWESRFKSDPLLTEEALFSCMAYVDLNPIRAGMATTPESSDHTSLKERIEQRFDLAEAVKCQVDNDTECPLRDFTLPLKPLLPFEGNVIAAAQHGLLFAEEDYLTLVDVTGRSVRQGKRGFIPQELPPILERLDIDFHTWRDNATSFEALYAQRFKPRRQPQAA